ncbi:hypothetical protein [Neorhizobium tomejilense]|uniref:hypothetical protein n=1 Tax=Neorhizobium tomejilense TaxID=2093828 RepID=UPI003ECDAD85
MTYMATLEELETAGVLKRVRIRIALPDRERRSLWVMPAVENWIRKELKELVAFEPTDISPELQARGLFKMFIAGEALSEGEEFRLMRPMEHDVYELRSADLRFFGWFYRPSVFIAVAADTMERVHTISGLSSGYRNAVSAARASINLDPPKYIEGASIRHVFSI